MQAWDRAFPGVFTPITQASLELQAHFRYPENLFQAQAFHFANYHVEDAAGFYRKQHSGSAGTIRPCKRRSRVATPPLRLRTPPGGRCCRATS